MSVQSFIDRFQYTEQERLLRLHESYPECNEKLFRAFQILYMNGARLAIYQGADLNGCFVRLVHNAASEAMIHMALNLGADPGILELRKEKKDHNVQPVEKYHSLRSNEKHSFLNGRIFALAIVVLGVILVNKYG